VGMDLRPQNPFMNEMKLPTRLITMLAAAKQGTRHFRS